MSDVVGSASIEITPDSTSFSDDLNAQISAALDGVTASLGAQVGDASAAAAAALGDVASAAGDVGTAAADAGSSMSLNFDMATIGAIALGTAVGESVTGAISTAADAVTGLVTALPSLGGEIQGAFNSIRVSTGATGEELASLQESFDNIAVNTPASLNDVGQVVTSLSQRLGLSGEQLEETGLSFIRFSRLTGTSIPDNLSKLTGAFNAWGVEAGDQTTKLDELFRVYQETGVPVAQLTSAMNSMGGVSRQLGLSFEDTAAITGQLSLAGLNAGAVQMAFTKVVKAAADEGVDAGTKLRSTFDGIADGSIGMDEAFKLFGPRAAAVIDLIQSGKLDFEGLSAQIAAGGDTMKEAASDTKTWKGQLAGLANMLKIYLEPIALTVFKAMNDAMVAIKPLIAALYENVANLLIPVFANLAIAVKPIWDIFGRLIPQLQALWASIMEGDSQGVAEILDNVFGNTGEYVDQIRDLATTFFDAWETISGALSTAWGVIQPIFEQIGTWITELVAENPGAFIAGFAASLTAVLLPALQIVGSALAGVVVAFVSFIGPMIAVPLAIGALVAGLVLAYQHIDGFRAVVDSVAGAFMDWFDSIGGWEGIFAMLQAGWDLVLGAITGVGEYLTETILPIFVTLKDAVLGALEDSVIPAFEKLFESLGGGSDILQWMIDHWQILGLVALHLIAPWMTWIMLFAALWEKSEAYRDVITGLIDVIGDFVGNVITAFSGLVDIVSGIFGGDWEKVKGGISKLAEGILGVLSDLFAKLPSLAVDAIQGVLDAILGALGNIPVLGNLFDGVKDLVDGVARALGGVFEILDGIFSMDFEKVLGGLGEIFGGLKDGVLGALGSLGGLIADAVTTLLPILANAFMTLLGNIPGWILTALGALGSLLVTAITAAWDWVVENGPGILANIGLWLASLPGLLISALGSLGELLGGWWLAAFDWVVENGLSLLGTLLGWVLTIPALIIQGLWELGGLLVGWITGAFGWLVENGPGILAGLWEWVIGLPGTIVGWLVGLDAKLKEWAMAAFNWVVTNGPEILAGLWEWIKALPGNIISKLGDLGVLIKDWLVKAFNWVVEEAPKVVQGLIDFFSGLPEKIFNAISSGLSSAGGAIADVGKQIYNAVAKFVNEHLLDPVRTFKVTILSQDFTPFEKIPEMPVLAAKGLIADSPTLAIFGEAGREAAVPLDDEAAGVNIAMRAGIPGMLRRAGVLEQTGIGGGDTVVVQVVVTPPEGADMGWAEDLGETIGRAAGDAAQRKLQIRAAVRAA